MGAVSTDATWSFRAQTAADAVNTAFGHRLLALPGTWIGAVQYPRRSGLRPWAEWHYWWQAHYLDCLVDSAWRQSAAGPELGQLPEPLRRAEALLRAIRLRNYLHLTNSFYDDMAWLALATGRADALARTARPQGLPAARRASARLGAQLLTGDTQDLGGGMFWSRKRDFKNTPATGPSALYFARNDQPDRAQRLLDWLRNTLYDPATGLYLDGIHPHPSGPEIERTIYTYNQGPVLGALLELGGAANLASAAELIEAIGLQLTQAWAAPARDGVSALAQEGASDGGNLTFPGGRLRPLRLEGSGDHGLFSGILARYLAAAATHPVLPEPARTRAAGLVLDTAEALWLGRSTQPFTHFPEQYAASAPSPFAAPAPAPSAPVSIAAGAPAAVVELSSQLQAWMAFEAAFRVTDGLPAVPESLKSPPTLT